jgi:hypothetical protein
MSPRFEKEPPGKNALPRTYQWESPGFDRNYMSGLDERLNAAEG